MNESLQEIMELRDAGKSIREIGRITGKTAGYISGVMSRNRDIFPIKDHKMQAIRMDSGKKKQKVVKPRKVGKLAAFVGIPPSPVGRKNMGKQYWSKLNAALSQATGEDLQETEAYIVSSEVIEMKKSSISSNIKRQMFHEALKPTPPPKPKQLNEEYDNSRLPYAVTFDLLDDKRCCKWAITDNPKGYPNLFCGEVKAGKNYCQIHQERAWRAA